MRRNPFVPIVFILFIVCIIGTTFSSCANSVDTKNNILVREYCNKHYQKYTIRVITKYNPKVMEDRKDKKIVYVERFVSYSKGTYGYSKKGEYVKYNKKVPKGKKVISYFVCNPETNYCDDVVAVIDCGKIR